MVVAKNGPKLEATKSGSTTLSMGPTGKPHEGAPATINARRYSMTMLARLISTFGPGPTVDQTGLEGDYDFTLSSDESAGPSLFTAVQQELGLRLESRKVPLSNFVIESARRPNDN